MRSLSCSSVLAVLASLIMNAKAAEPFRKVLLSAAENIHVDTWDVSGRKITSKQPGWSVRKIALRGGKQDGVDLIIVDNGKLKFTVIPTRGLGVLSVSIGDVTLGWKSPVQEVVHPRHINLHSRGGLGWLEGFNEWLVRCGLESNGRRDARDSLGVGGVADRRVQQPSPGLAAGAADPL